MSPAKDEKAAVIPREELETLMYGGGRVRRFTQDSPILPDVWIAYGKDPSKPQDLLLTPHHRSSAGELSRVLRDRLEKERAGSGVWKRLHGKEAEPDDIAYNQSTVVARLYFDELVRVVLPMTGWWQDYVWKHGADALGKFLGNQDHWKDVAEAIQDPEKGVRQLESLTGNRWSPDLLWMFLIVGRIAAEQLKVRVPKTEGKSPRLMREVLAVARLMEGLIPSEEKKAVLWSVNRNREAEPTVTRSSLAVKADAARRLFNVTCKDLRWAVIDSGIDARHHAFRLREMKDGRSVPCSVPEEGEGGDWSDRTRVIATYDFTPIRELLNPSRLDPDNPPAFLKKRLESLSAEKVGELKATIKDLKAHLINGREIDWSLFEPALRVPHDKGYETPEGEHGTHVAGILAADWRAGEPGREGDTEDLQGICPDLNLYDIRVLENDGAGDEFAVIAALQFVRYLNAHKDHIVVHGANLSLSIRHDVSNFACGCTPVCEESERLVAAGIVVVAAAGNQGFHELQTAKGPREAYNSISITDPGNADGVITVGATHRYRPHTYGVSYFSSRGPTGDGRVKPDLVAPGEKIKAPVPGNDCRRKDGTSMAAPHVSGAAALLMARHDELIGKPQRVKRILCETATDLGRERYFQGCGMVDILRALQSV
ncbi:MAG TPA: S8 family serine peptidase [Thermoanaerobaculia bacterium]